MSVLWEETIHGGAMWSHILKRGSALRLVDLEGAANVGALFYNADNITERFNMPDTLKAQHISRLTKGNVLYSDMGRILCSVTEDTCGWHDPLGGCSNAASVKARYGESRYQEHRNDCHKNGRDQFLVELAKHGLGARDLIANMNFFSKVAVGRKGETTFVIGNSRPGNMVELRAEMNTLVILNTCPHPMDPSPSYAPKPVRVSVHHMPPPDIDDLCRNSCPENERGFVLTKRYFL